VAYTAEKTFAAGAVLPASELNTYLRDNMKAIMESASIGTTLPASPVDGQLFWYVADASARVLWGLKFNNGGPTGKKWEFAGGGDLIVGSGAGFTTSGSYADVGVSVTVPLGGEYLARWGVRQAVGANDNYYLLTPKYGTAATVDSDGSGGQWPANPIAHPWAEGEVKTLAAGDVLKLQFRQTLGSTNPTLTGIVLRVRPVRVG
jgi:hypothetical protein